MPRVIFTKTYRYTPTLERRVCRKYVASDKPVLVNTDCASKAIRDGYAVEAVAAPPPRRPRRLAERVK